MHEVEVGSRDVARLGPIPLTRRPSVSTHELT
jgi:hypothetical protein